MKKIINQTLITILVVISIFVFGFSLHAEEKPKSNAGNFADKMGFQAEIMHKTSGLGDAAIGDIVAGVIKAALSLLGLIFLIIIIFAGYRWMTASGNEEQVKKAQEAIKRSIIGLVIVLLAYAIMVFVFSQLPFDGFNGSGTNPHGSPK